MELLLKVAQKQLPSLNTDGLKLTQRLVACELAEYQLIGRVLIEAAEAIRFASASYSDKEVSND